MSGLNPGSQVRALYGDLTSAHREAVVVSFHPKFCLKIPNVPSNPQIPPTMVPHVAIWYPDLEFRLAD